MQMSSLVSVKAVDNPKSWWPHLSSSQISRLNQDYQKQIEHNTKTFHSQLNSGQLFEDRNFPCLIRTTNCACTKRKSRCTQFV